MSELRMLSSVNGRGRKVVLLYLFIRCRLHPLVLLCNCARTLLFAVLRGLNFYGDIGNVSCAGLLSLSPLCPIDAYHVS